jgi:hypothetical protein
MVESLRKKQPDLKQRRIQRDKNPASVPPSGAPSWCLTREALEKYNRSIENIPTYDYDTDDTDHDISQDDTENEESRKTTRKRKRKSKKKKKVKTSKHKK